MNDHLVEQVEYTGTVGLRCHTCDWFMNIGHHNGMSIDQRQHLQPLVTLLRWAHTDPSRWNPATTVRLSRVDVAAGAAIPRRGATEG